MANIQRELWRCGLGKDAGTGVTHPLGSSAVKTGRVYLFWPKAATSMADLVEFRISFTDGHEDVIGTTLGAKAVKGVTLSEIGFNAEHERIVNIANTGQLGVVSISMVQKAPDDNTNDGLIRRIRDLEAKVN